MVTRRIDLEDDLELGYRAKLYVQQDLDHLARQIAVREDRIRAIAAEVGLSNLEVETDD